MRFDIKLVFLLGLFCCSSNESSPPGLPSLTGGTSDSLFKGQLAVEELLYRGALSSETQKDLFEAERLTKIEKTVLGRSYLRNLSSQNVRVLEKEVIEYYEKNKQSFRQQSSSAKVYHVFLEQKDEADNVRRVFALTGKKREKNDVFQKYNVKPRLVTEGEILKELNDAIFKQTKKKLHGPIKSRFGYHVVFVLERFAKKTVPPIELLYDEIYQRLHQKKTSLKALNVLDSLTVRALN